MTLTVKTAKHQYAFEGPYTAASSLSKKSGVYLISTVASSGKHDVIDVGESADVNDRVAHHDRTVEWQQHKQSGLYCSAHYCNESSRMSLEAELRAYFKPVGAENLIHPVHPASRYSLIKPPRISFRRNCAGSGSSIGSGSTAKVPGAC